MVAELITLPVRVGVRATRLWFRALEETFSVTSSATGRVIDLLGSRGSNVDGERRGESAAGSPARPAQPERDNGRVEDDGSKEVSPPSVPTQELEPPPAPPAPAAPPSGAPSASGPAHVSEEPELVEEFAEPGAEQGAGAEVRVDPPWDGYERMNAKQVISRLAGAGAAELAAVQLYESSNRHRQTILTAVERELRSANGGGSRSH